MKARRMLVGGLLAVLSLEVASAVAYSAIEGRVFSFARARAERSALAAVAATADGTAGESDEPEGGEQEAAGGDESRDLPIRLDDQVLHPYVGFVFDPAANTPEILALLGDRHITEFGFVGREGFFEEPGEDRLVIGLTGGSVAFRFSGSGVETLSAELRKAPELANKEIVYVTMALPGFKQPQQLLALEYCLSLGAHFDWVINIDGFNEVALPYLENAPKGVADVFPRSWYWRVLDVPDPRSRRLMGEVAYLEEARREWARGFSRSPLTYSVAMNLVWKLRDRRLAAGARRAEWRLVEDRPEEVPFVARGPARSFPDEETMFAELARLWARSSLQMHGACESLGIRYFHFLQPNQHVRNSKKMGRAEREIAFTSKNRYRKPVIKGYGGLFREGRGLKQAGVFFHAATDVFKDVEEPLYIDNCCHFNAAGNRILARRIARDVLADLGLSPAAADERER